MKGVSIIIPCYKAGSYLLEAVASVRAVTPQLPYEIIVVDDFSNDPSTSFALNVLHVTAPNVKIITQPLNRGQSAARNAALNVARYDYIMPLDADDMLNPKRPGYLEKSVQYLEDYPELALTYSKCRFIGTRAGPAIHTNYDEETFLLRNMIPAYGIYRRSEAIEAGGYRDNLRYAEDWEFWTHLLEKRLEAGAPRYVHRFREAHYLYRQHDTGENVSVREKMPMNMFFNQITQRNSGIYDLHFGTVDGDELSAIRRQRSSPTQMFIEVAESATGREFVEIAWHKLQKMMGVSGHSRANTNEPRPQIES